MQIPEPAEILAYLAAAWLIVRRMRGDLREILFAVLNVAGYYLFFVHGNGLENKHAFAAYVPLVLVQFVVMRLFAHRSDWTAWLAFFTPILALVAVRYAPAGHFIRASGFVGLSYLAFRNSLLVIEIRNGVVQKPGICRYLGYSFFVPTMPVGPINPYSEFRRAFDDAPPAIPAGRALLRIMVGIVKYKLLGSLCDQLSYTGLLLDYRMHPWTDVPVAVVFYYLYLYCNFSGFCDMAIGAAGLIGIPVPENFDNPFAARNVKDFWNRWHITLSQYMREVVFAPLSKFLARILGPARVNHAVALTIVVVFLLVGVWHGVGWNFFLFGAVHALGVVTNHYYTIGLKKWLGRDGFRAYNSSRMVHAAAVGLTFCYCAASLFFFANTIPEMKEILDSIK